MILLNEQEFEKIQDPNKPLYIYEWLNGIQKQLEDSSSEFLKNLIDPLSKQILNLIKVRPGPSVRKLISRSLCTIISKSEVTNTFMITDTLIEIIRSDDSLYSTNSRLTAIFCIGNLFKSSGKTLNSCHDSCVVLLTKILKNSDSQIRCEIMDALANIVIGFSNPNANIVKEIWKAAKQTITDRSHLPKYSAIKCMHQLIINGCVANANDLEQTGNLCLRSFEFATPDVRHEGAKLLASVLLARAQLKSITAPAIGNSSSNGDIMSMSSSSTNAAPSQQANPPIQTVPKKKVFGSSDALQLLVSGFLKGPSGFLKGSSDVIKGSNSVNREIRVGVTYAFIEFFSRLGSDWLQANFNLAVGSVLSLLQSPSKYQFGSTSSGSTTTSQCETVFTRHCVRYILLTVTRKLLSEEAQIQMALCLLHDIKIRLNVTNFAVDNQILASARTLSDDCLDSTKLNSQSNDDSIQTDLNNQSSSVTFVNQNEMIPGSDASSNAKSNISVARGFPNKIGYVEDQYFVATSFDVIRQLVIWLDSLSVVLVKAPGHLLDCIYAGLSHPTTTVRLASAACLKQIAVVLPLDRIILIDRCIHFLQVHKCNAEVIQGYSIALATLISGANFSSFEIPMSKYKEIFSLAEEFLRSASQNSRLTMCRTQAGWYLLSACLCIHSSNTRMLSKSMSQSSKDAIGSNTINPSIAIGVQQIFLPRMHNLWRNAFPRSGRELDQERQKGDAFTWQLWLEARIGALTSIQAFLQFLMPTSGPVQSLAAILEDNLKWILPTIECALNLIANLPTIIRTFGQHLKLQANMLRLRLYRCLALLPAKVFTNAYSAILRELVAEFTLTDSITNIQASLYEFLCQHDSSTLLQSLSKDSCYLEEQFLPNTILSNGFPCLEHDPTALFLVHYIPQNIDIPELLTGSEGVFNEPSAMCRWPLLQEQGTNQLLSRMSASRQLECSYPVCGLVLPFLESPPIHIAVIDCSISIFGKIFPYVSAKHRYQTFQHFDECVKIAKSTRSDVIRMNILAAILCSLRQLSESKLEFGPDAELRKSCMLFALNSVSRPNPIVRATACECLGRLCQTVGENAFLQDLVQFTFDRLRQVRDTVSRAGHSFLVGQLHCNVGSLASGHHLNASVGLLLGLAQDSSTPDVQAWALKALTMTADSGGPMFRQFVEPSLNLVQQLFFRTPAIHIDIHRCLGKLLSSLITCLGPELQGASAKASSARMTCIQCCLMMRDSEDPWLEAETVICMHQLHMFSPEHFPLRTVIPRLERYLLSDNINLRRATVNCLRYLSQKEAFALTVYWEEIVSQYLVPTSSQETIQRHRLEAVLFALLDTETDWQTRRDTEETILSLQQSLAVNQPQQWVVVLKDVLKVSSSSGFSELSDDQGFKRGLHQKFMDENERPLGSDEEDLEEDDNEAAFDRIAIQASTESQERTLRIALSGNARWSTRVFALGCLRRLFFIFDTDAASEFDSRRSKENQTQLANSIYRLCGIQQALLNDPLFCKTLDYNNLLPTLLKDSSLRIKTHNGNEFVQQLVPHVADLIKIAFIYMTKPQDQLRISGLLFLQLIIQQFAHLPDPEYPLNSILEQHEAQVSAALRIAFQPLLASSEGRQEELRFCGKQIQKPSINCQFLALAASVCSTWLFSDVLRDSLEIKKVIHLLELALDRLKVESNLSMATEVSDNGLVDSLDTCSTSTVVDVNTATTLQHLAIMNVWADIYAVSNTAKLQLNHLKVTQLIFSVIGGMKKSNTNKKHLQTVFRSLTNQELAPLHARIAESLHHSSLIGPLQQYYSMFNKSSYKAFIDSSGNIEDTEFSNETSKRFDLDLGDALLRQQKRLGRILKHLGPLIDRHLEFLSKAWCLALQDCIFLTSQSSSLQTATQGQNLCMAGTFFSEPSGAKFDRQRAYFALYWPKLMRAASTWFACESLRRIRSVEDIGLVRTTLGSAESTYQLLISTCLEALCGDLNYLLRIGSNNVIGKSMNAGINTRYSVDLADILSSLIELLRGSAVGSDIHPEAAVLLATNLFVFRHSSKLSFELLTILKRIALSQDSPNIHLLIVQICFCLSSKWTMENLTACSKYLYQETDYNLTTKNNHTPSKIRQMSSLEIAEWNIQRKSFTIAILEVLLSIFTKYYPAILHTLAPSVNTLDQAPGSHTRFKYANPVLTFIYQQMIQSIQLLSFEENQADLEIDILNHHRIILRLIIQTGFAELIKPCMGVEMNSLNIWNERLTNEYNESISSFQNLLLFLRREQLPCFESLLVKDPEFANFSTNLLISSDILDFEEEIHSNQTMLLILGWDFQRASIAKSLVHTLWKLSETVSNTLSKKHSNDFMGTLASAINLILTQHGCGPSGWSPGRICCLSSLYLVSNVLSRAPASLWQKPISNMRETLGSCVFNLIKISIPQDSSLLQEYTLAQSAIAFQALRNVLSHTDSAVVQSGIRIVMPKVFRWIDKLAKEIEASKSLPMPPLHLRLIALVVQDSLELAESLLTHCDANSRASLMLIVVAAYSRLLDSSFGQRSGSISLLVSENQSRRGHLISWQALIDALHIISVSKAFKLIIRFPAEFKSISASLGEQKDLLEQSIRAFASSKGPGSPNIEASSHKLTAKSEHSIKLKMDFTDFS